jgi:acetyltransferase
MITIEDLTTDDLRKRKEEFANLLMDAVESGASVGFLAPLKRQEALTYWRDVEHALPQRRILLGAFDGTQLVGSVQLDLAQQANARHRAEVMKLIVLENARRRGIGRALMMRIEEIAREAGRTLLVLDTRKGDAAEPLYRSLGYCELGVIPRYAMSSAGVLRDTIFFYREI